MEIVTVETLDRVNEAEGETEFKKTAAAASGGGREGKESEKTQSVIYLPNQGTMSGLWLA